MANEEINRKKCPSPTGNGLESRQRPGTRHTVLVWDANPSRSTRITNLLNEAGIVVRSLGGTAPPEPTHMAGCNPIALIGLIGDFRAESPGWLTIAACKSAEFTVIAFADGVKQWPVRSKCQPLLAGAAHLLDSGAPDFPSELCRLLGHALETWTQESRDRQEIRNSMGRHGLVGESRAITEVFGIATRYSHLSDLPVLITGESGTGKELLARAIAAMDPKRKDGPFVAVNCAAINPTLMESEFFGHRRGSFTGAERDRKGLIRAAEGGTLFLDEIGELELGLQAKLLRALQENRILAIGEERETPVNVRFMAATNQNLEQLVAERRFRGDLFHRLRVLSVRIPPIRERPADIAPLVAHFLQKRRSLQAVSTLEATADFLEALKQLEFPGNVRQLENLVYHTLAHHQTNLPLDLNDLPPEVVRLIANREQIASHETARVDPDPQLPLGALSRNEMNELVKRILDGHGWNLSKAMDECERHLFQVAMQRTGGNQSQTARLLGITPRSVYNKVQKFRLHS